TSEPFLEPGSAVFVLLVGVDFVRGFGCESKFTSDMIFSFVWCVVSLDRCSVQFLEARVREGETFRHIHSSADDFDVCARFTLAGCFQSGIELAERFDTRGKPIGTSESVRHISVTPFCQIVVGPVWVWLQ